MDPDVVVPGTVVLAPDGKMMVYGAAGWKEFKVEATPMRQTGRTTRMLIEAHDAKVLGERVLIIAPNHSVMDQLIRTARSLGIMDGGVQPRPLVKADFTSTHHVMQGKLRGFRGVLFEDHTVQEFGPPIAYTREVHLWQATIAPREPEPVEPEGPRWSFTSF